MSIRMHPGWRYRFVLVLVLVTGFGIAGCRKNPEPAPRPPSDAGRLILTVTNFKGTVTKRCFADFNEVSPTDAAQKVTVGPVYLNSFRLYPIDWSSGYRFLDVPAFSSMPLPDTLIWRVTGSNGGPSFEYADYNPNPQLLDTIPDTYPSDRAWVFPINNTTVRNVDSANVIFYGGVADRMAWNGSSPGFTLSDSVVTVIAGRELLIRMELYKRHRFESAGKTYYIEQQYVISKNVVFN